MKSEVEMCCGTIANSYKLREELEKALEITSEALSKTDPQAWYVALCEVKEILDE